MHILLANVDTFINDEIDKLNNVLYNDKLNTKIKNIDNSKFYCSSWHCNRQVSRIFTSSAINRDVFDITCDSNKNRIKTIKGKEYINTTYFGQYCIINTIYNKSYYRRYLDEMRLINRYILLKEREIKIDHDFVYKYNLVDNQQYRERFKVNLLEFQN